MKIISKTVLRLQILFKNKKVSTNIVIEAIMDTLDTLGIDDDFEITDELIESVEKLYYEPVDQEKESLNEANKKFNTIVQGMNATKCLYEDDWIPTSQINEQTKADWDRINNSLELIKSRYDQMVQKTC